MKVMIFGAAGVGKTTLGAAVARQLDFKHLDSDNYYWKQTQPTFKGKRSRHCRNRKIRKDFKAHENVILSGSMMSWGKKWDTAFDLVVFLRLDNKERLARLSRREKERYGEALINNPKIKKNSQEFMEWASQYENPYFKGNSLRFHLRWLQSCPSPVLQLDSRDDIITNTRKLISRIDDLI